MEDGGGKSLKSPIGFTKEALGDVEINRRGTDIDVAQEGG
jgi:hypothetical protein